MMIGLCTTKRNSNTSLIINDDMVSDSNDIADSNNFVSIGTELSDSISSNVNLMSYVSYVENSMFMADLKERMRRQGCHITVENTSAGWDNLPTSIVEKCVDGYLASFYIISLLNRT